jgi:hypothetical protein
MNNSIQTWSRGAFIHFDKYKRWSREEKDRAEEREKLLVRPDPTGNAICQCNNPDDAKWIASRLNLASILEQMTYDYATGKTDGSEITKLVMEAVS